MKLILIYISCALSLKVYHSTLSTNENKPTSGLKYLQGHKKNISFTNNLSFCARFNYKRLNVMLFMAYSKNKFETPFIHFRITYPQAFFAIGNRLEENSFGSWTLNDPKTNEFVIWYAYQWHHVCFAYKSVSSHIALVKVYFYFKTHKAPKFSYKC